MKKLIFGLLLSVTTLGFNACSSDDNDVAPAPSGGNNTFTVKIDTVTFTPYVISVTRALGEIKISATDLLLSQVSIVMPDSVAPGTYSLPTVNSSGTYYGEYGQNGLGVSVSSSGTLTVTSHNTTTKKVIGTFSFVCESPIPTIPPTVNLTNGSFSVTYQ